MPVFQRSNSRAGSERRGRRGSRLRGGIRLLVYGGENIARTDERLGASARTNVRYANDVLLALLQVCVVSKSQGRLELPE